MGPRIKYIDPKICFLRSARDLLQYLKWRGSRSGKISFANLGKLKDKYRGQKAIIVCNGPSLKSAKLELLNETFTFGLNKINLLFESSDFRPSCIVSVNSFVIGQNKKFYETTDIPLFLDQRRALANRIKANGNRTLLFSHDGYPGFSCDARYAVNQGATVTYVALQLAYFMGFEKIGLIGCDHNFSTKGPDHKVVRGLRIDENHFHPNYFPLGTEWQLPSLAQSEESYMIAKRFYEYDNRSIYNCSDSSKLTVYPKLTIEGFLAL